MLSHLTRLIGIVNACNAALANLSDPRSLAEVATMKQTAEILMSSLATDDPNRDATLELVWASPLNFALACQVVKLGKDAVEPFSYRRKTLDGLKVFCHATKPLVIIEGIK